MSFNTFEMLFLFIPIALVTYWPLVKRGKSDWAMRLVSLETLVFYAVSYYKSTPILLLSLGLNYFFISKIFTSLKSKRWMIAGVVFDILLLCVQKYTPLIFDGFVIEATGISYYTFCEIALVVESYRKTIKKIGFTEYSFWMVFFPKIMQGPIMVPDTKSDNIYPKGKAGITAEEIFRAIMLFSFGLFKKVIIADTLAAVASFGYDNPNAIHTGEALIIVLSYGFQVYFDFTGYCDMGMGIAALFGIELPVNFNSPFKATSIEDFWKRWHITLTKFFTKYLYIPLGGNRKGKARMYLNFMIVFMVSALWHGVGINFIIWGILHGGMYVITRFVRMRHEEKHAGSVKKEYGPVLSKIIHVLKVALTFLFINVTWIFFGEPTIESAMRYISSLGECWFPRLSQGLANCFNIDELWYVIKVAGLDKWEYGIYILPVVILVVLTIIIFFAPNSIQYSGKCKISIWNTLLVAILLIWSIMSMNGVASYVYMNF